MNDLKKLSSPALPKQELENLISTLNRANGFTLLFAQCNSPLIRESVLNTIETQCKRPIVRVDLSDHFSLPNRSIPIDALIHSQAINTSPEATLSVAGLEIALPSLSPERAKRTAQEINLRRTAYQRFLRPILIWLPEYALTLLAQNAPDFFDWYSGSFTFDIDVQTNPIPYESIGEIGIANLSYKEKENRLNTLFSLLKEAKNTHSESNTAHLLGDIGLILAFMGDYTNALTKLNNAKTIFQSLEDYDNFYTIKLNIASTYLMKGEINKALSLLIQEILPFFKKKKAISKIIASKRILAVIYQTQENNQKALELIDNELLPYYIKIGNKLSIAGCKTLLAEIYVKTGALDNALAMLQNEILPIFQEAEEFYFLANTYGIIALILEKQGELHEALRIHLDEVLPIYLQLGDKREIAITLWAIGRLERQLRDDVEALKHFQESYRIITSLNSPHDAASIAEDYGLLLLHHGETIKAIPALEDSAKAYRQIGNEKDANEIDALIDQTQKKDIADTTD